VRQCKLHRNILRVQSKISKYCKMHHKSDFPCCFLVDLARSQAYTCKASCFPVRRKKKSYETFTSRFVGRDWCLDVEPYTSGARLELGELELVER